MYMVLPNFWACRSVTSNRMWLDLAFSGFIILASLCNRFMYFSVFDACTMIC